MIKLYAYIYKLTEKLKHRIRMMSQTIVAYQLLDYRKICLLAIVSVLVNVTSSTHMYSSYETVFKFGMV